jgi:TATA-binding protein-associated factor Taf7
VGRNFVYFSFRETSSRQLSGPGESKSRNSLQGRDEKNRERNRQVEEDRNKKGEEEKEEEEEEGKNKFGKRPSLIRDKIREVTQSIVHKASVAQSASAVGC